MLLTHKEYMSFEIRLFAHETMDMSLPIKVCQWCVSLSIPTTQLENLALRTPTLAPKNLDPDSGPKIRLHLRL